MQQGAEGEVLGPLPAYNVKELQEFMLQTTDRQVQERIRDRAKMLAEVRADRQRQINPHRPLWEVMSDGTWAGERCFIIGGGPSLIGFDFECLHGRGRIIAINKTYLDVPFADILFFMDGSKTTFYGLVQNGKLALGCLERWKEFQGHKVFLNIMGRKYDDVHSVRAAGRTGLSNSLRHGLYHGNNSGVGAVGLAVCLGANPIYLLGIDAKFRDGQSHYHGGYPGRMAESVFRSFVTDFERMNRFLGRTSFRVVNLNPDSGVRCFPFSTIDEVLGDEISATARLDQAKTAGL